MMVRRPSRFFRIAMADDPENRDALFGLINALTITGDDAAATPLRETAKRLELLNTLIQQAASPQGRNNPKLLQELGAASPRPGRQRRGSRVVQGRHRARPARCRGAARLFRLASHESPRATDQYAHHREPTRQ